MDPKVLLRHSCGLSFEVDRRAILHDVKGEWRVLVTKGEGIISTTIDRDTFFLIVSWLMDHQVPMYLHTSLESIQYFTTELQRFPHIVYVPSLLVELQSILLGQCPSAFTITPATPLRYVNQNETKHGSNIRAASPRPPPHGRRVATQGVVVNTAPHPMTNAPRFGYSDTLAATAWPPPIPVAHGIKDLSRYFSQRFHRGAASPLSSVDLAQEQAQKAPVHSSSVLPASSTPSFSSAATALSGVRVEASGPTSFFATTALPFGHRSPGAAVTLDGVIFSPLPNAVGDNDMDCSND